MRGGRASLVLCLLLVGCRARPALYDVVVDPAAISPNQDGQADVARIQYGVGMPVLVSIDLVDSGGAVHALRTSQPREPGPHEALFGGVIDGRMLPDGDYTVRITAVPRDLPGVPAAVEERQLAIHGGDTSPPVLAGFTVQPSTFTPNQDGIGDRVSISYRLDEPADVRVWLETADGTYVTDILEEQASAESAGQVGPHVYDYDAGVDADAPPPPDGDYAVVAEARDVAGNVTRERLPLAIRDGGQPRAAIVGDVQWSRSVVPLGATVTFTTTVQNVGSTPIRTRGPEPGFVYDNNQTFNQAAPAGWVLWVRGGGRTVARWLAATGTPTTTVSVDLAGPSSAPPATNSAISAAALQGAQAGASAVAVCGRVSDGSRAVPRARVVAFESDGDNGVETETGRDGSFCLAGLRLPPAAERTYARSPGAIRLALEYDEKATDLEYPFRWQLGRSEELDVCRSGDSLYLCLPPGANVQVTGSLCFVEAPFRRTTNAYLALMHEDVRKMQGPYNLHLLTIEH
jgi:hypothetical protein